MGIQINFNGKTYNSIDEMPPEARQAYEQAMALLADQNANGLPDFMDAMLQGQPPEQVLQPLNALASSQTQIIYNGQTYNSLDAMPAEARQAYQQAMGALDLNADSQPDAFEAIGFKDFMPAAAPRPQTAAASAPMHYTPAGVEPEPGDRRPARRRLIAIAVLALVVLFVVAAMLLFVFVAGPSLVGLR